MPLCYATPDGSFNGLASGGMMGWSATSSTASYYYVSQLGNETAGTASDTMDWRGSATQSAASGWFVNAAGCSTLREHALDVAARARHHADVAEQSATFEQQEQQERAVLLRVIEFERELASVRARELLLSKLSPEQRKTFTDSNWFLVEGSRTKTKYRIRGDGYVGNIDVLDVADIVTSRLCAHCAVDIPLEDHLLSQKLMLELAEDSIIRLANKRAA